MSEATATPKANGKRAAEPKPVATNPGSGTHNFSCGKKGWGGTPMEGQHIPLRVPATTAEALAEGGPFANEQALLNAAVAQLNIVRGKPMLDAYKESLEKGTPLTVDELAAIGNGVVYGVKRRKGDGTGRKPALTAEQQEAIENQRKLREEWDNLPEAMRARLAKMGLAPK